MIYYMINMNKVFIRLYPFLHKEVRLFNLVRNVNLSTLINENKIYIYKF